MSKINLKDSLPIVSLFIIFIIDFTLIVSVHWQWNHSMHKYLPLQTHIQTLKSDISNAHLWLEEALAGDRYVDVENDVMLPLKHQSLHLYLESLDTVLTDKEDVYYINKLKLLDIKLADFHTMAQHRWEESKQHGIGSDLDQFFDKEFKSILSYIDEISLSIDHKLSDELADRTYYFSWIIVLFLLINFAVFSMLIISKRRQKAYYDSLIEEKERAMITLGSIGDAVITTDVNGNITFFNDVAEILAEYKNEEVQGTHIDTVLNLYNIKTGEKIITPISDVIHKGITKLISNGTRLVSSTGKEYIVSDSAAPVMDENGEVLGTVLVFQDDTERYKMQEELKRSEAKYRSLVESVKQHYFFYSHNIEGVFTYLSNSLTDVTGYSPKEFETHYAEYLTDDPINDIVEEVTEKSIQGEVQEPYTLSIYHKNGSICYLEVIESPVFDDEGNVTAVEGVARDVTDNYLAHVNIQEQKELLTHRANHDTLTNLPNRQLFLDRLSQSIKYAQRFEEKVAVLFIDLDHFKEINDSLGHYVGDEVLKIVAAKLEEQIRETDTLARLGGDEFIIILDTLDDANIIVDIVKKLMDAMNNPILIQAHHLYITLSIGISLYPDDGKISEDLLKNADAAMYNAKDSGRNTYCFYRREMTKKAYERIEMETSLRQALERDEFVIFYQPQVDGHTDNIVGIEALIRWDHPQKGMISPMTFIPLAEEIGLIIPIDRWVMKHAIRQYILWKQEGLNPGKLALNLSIKQLRQADFLPFVSTILKETGCKPEWITLEVTETEIMKNPEYSILKLQDLSDMGIELAVDDFGTGYSSLSYLKKLPIHKLKIDKSFVEGLPYDKEDVGIVRALIILSESLELDIIAEGVETPEQQRFLVENGCRDIQGYLHSKPLPTNKMEKMLQEFNVV